MMTNTQLVTNLFTITENLLEAGVTPCTVHEAWEQLNHLFNEYERNYGIDGDINELLSHLLTKSECDFNEATQNNQD